jgi:hypothetical protein
MPLYGLLSNPFFEFALRKCEILLALRFWVKLKTLAKAEYVLELEGVDEHVICG